MNMNTQSRILKACKICGLNVRPAKSWSGDRYVALIYNKAGDSTSFNPSQDIGHAMQLLLAVGGTLIVSNKESKCWVYLEKDYPEKHLKNCVSGSWLSNPKSKSKNICNAIINCILTKAVEDEAI